MPCADVIIEESCGTEIHYHALADHEHGQDIDLCSPFCQCHCCHTHVTNFQGFGFDVLAISFPKKLTHYTNNKGDEIKNSLLQPPQV